MLMVRGCVLLLALCAVTACGDDVDPRPAVRIMIPQESGKEAASFIVNLCKVSNPRSDEEPEDMIEEARATALALYGVPTRGMWVVTSQVFVSYTHCSPEWRTEIDAAFGPLSPQADDN